MLKSSIKIALILTATLQCSYYELLKIAPDATDMQVRKAYLNLAKLLHPDKNPEKNTTQLFQQLQKAYTTLRDPSLRRAYDVSLLSKENLSIEPESYECNCFNLSWYKLWTSFFSTTCSDFIQQ